MTCQFGVQWWHFLTVKGNCCFWWCFYTSVWLDHLISSFYLVWVIRANFGGSGDAFWRWWVTVVFDDISINEYGQIIIYHHCIWYGRWRANLGGSGHAFECKQLLLGLMMFSQHHYGQIIIYHHCILYGKWRPNFRCSFFFCWKDRRCLLFRK